MYLLNKIYRIYSIFQIAFCIFCFSFILCYKLIVIRNVFLFIVKRDLNRNVLLEIYNNNNV